MTDEDDKQEQTKERVRTVEVDCAFCKATIPFPFIKFGAKHTFDTGTLIGNKMTCSSCGKVTECNKENMLVVFVDEGEDISGGHVGKDIKLN